MIEERIDTPFVPERETPEYYEERAEQCERLGRSCTDRAAADTLRKLASDYAQMATALRRRGAGGPP